MAWSVEPVSSGLKTRAPTAGAFPWIQAQIRATTLELPMMLFEVMVF
jgi:hypothetical protein